MSNLDELINQYKNEDDQITCKDAFKIATKSKMEILEVGDRIKDMGYKITECGLGQFGNLDKSKYSIEAKEKLKLIVDDKNRVFCKEAREAAKGVGLPKIRGTIAFENIDIKYCELGCFSEKKGKKFKIKTKTWIEDTNKNTLLCKEYCEILETIEQNSSIEIAAKVLELNIEDIKKQISQFEKIFEIKAFNDEQKLTSEAKEFIIKYRSIKMKIEDYANRIFKDSFFPRREKK